MTGSLRCPGLAPWPNGAKAKKTTSFCSQNSRSSVSGAKKSLLLQSCGTPIIDPRTVDPSSGESCLHRFAHLTLVPLSFRTIEVPKSGLQRTSW
jgi:hypothetical protein